RAGAKALQRLVFEERVDVIHARSRAPGWAGWMAARATGAAFVTTWHGLYRETFPGKRLWNAVMARGRPTIAVSWFVADLIAGRHPGAEVVTIPRGVDLAAFDEGAVSGERAAGLAERWGLIETPRPVVMLPGRLTRWKGQAHFIDAAARLRAIRGREDFVFLMVGGDVDGAYAERLRKRIRAQNLDGCVALGGHCDDMAAAFKLASVVVSASIEPEAFGRVAAEAQAMGRPVVASDHGGARETVDEGRTGFRYAPGDPQALAEAVHRALELDESQRAHMSVAGRARVLQRFSLEAMERATLEVYAKAAARRG
ncbi:MAG: glycosyltransferase family 4 protein, partial [Pseudomonadota bacterium]